MNELISITNHGSWYEIAWYDHKTLLTKKVHGWENLLKFLKHACIKHTADHPLAFTKAVRDLIPMLTVNKSMTDQQAWEAIDIKMPGITFQIIN